MTLEVLYIYNQLLKLQVLDIQGLTIREGLNILG